MYVFRDSNAFFSFFLMVTMYPNKNGCHNRISVFIHIIITYYKINLMYVLKEYLPLKKSLEMESIMDVDQTRYSGLGVGREWCNKKFNVYQNVGLNKKLCMEKGLGMKESREDEVLWGKVVAYEAHAR